MALLKRYLPLLAFVALVLALAARLAWVAASTETGWETIGLTWREATLGRLGYHYTPISIRSVDEQAEFWLAEADRVLAEQGESAELAMGAAACLTEGPFILDDENSLYIYGTLSPCRLMWPDVRREKDEYGAFEIQAKCLQRATELGALATRLEPENVLWWRLRALLLSPSWTSGFSPRDPDWLAILDECARHDPDDGLYDDLAASALWHTSARVTYENGVPLLEVLDPDRFKVAEQYFEQGMRKRFHAAIPSARFAAAEFEQCASLSAAERSELLARHGWIKTNWPLTEIISWQQEMARLHRQGDDPAAQLAILQVAIHLVRQTEACEPLQSDEMFFQGLYSRLLLQSAELIESHPELSSAEEPARLRREAGDHLVRLRVLVAANPSFRPLSLTSPAIGPAIAATWTQTFVVLLLVISMMTWAMGRGIAGKQPDPPSPLGAWRHVLLWICALGTTFTLLGMLPARGILGYKDTRTLAVVGLPFAVAASAMVFWHLRRVARTWRERPDRVPAVRIVLGITLWQLVMVVGVGLFADVMPIAHDWLAEGIAQFMNNVPDIMIALLYALLAPLGWLLWRHRKRAKHLPWLSLTLLTILLFLTTIDMSAVQSARNFFEDYFRDINWPGEVLSPMVSPGLSPSIREALGFSLCCSGLIWRHLAGLGTTIALVLLLTALWHGARARRQSGEPFWAYWNSQRRARWGALLRCVGRSALAAAAVALVIYLAVAPEQVRAVEAAYQQRMVYVRDPLAHWREVRAAAEKIEQDASLMQQIRAEVAAKLKIPLNGK